MTNEHKIQVATLERVLKALTARARGLAGRKQDTGLRAAIETVEEIMDEVKNGTSHDKR